MWVLCESHLKYTDSSIIFLDYQQLYGIVF